MCDDRVFESRELLKYMCISPEQITVVSAKLFAKEDPNDLCDSEQTAYCVILLEVRILGLRFAFISMLQWMS